ncbi:MAG: (2Fe-2S)-binding protein [Bacillota bacterium]
MLYEVALAVNGQKYSIAVPADEKLIDTLRNRLALTGSKKGCGVGECGTCTVLINGKPVSSCLYLTVRAEGKEIMTIEGMGDPDQLHPLQENFKELQALQCGFCGPGILMSAKALLDKNPDPSDLEIKEALAGNLCRCTGHVKIIDAIKATAAQMQGRDKDAPQGV